MTIILLIEILSRMNIILSPLLITIIALVSFTFITLLYIIYNLYRKNTIYENWTENTFDKINNLQADIKSIDERGIFEKDDEVGSIFEEISNLIKDFDHDVKSNNKEL